MKLSNWLRDKLRKWLIPRSQAGVVSISVELEGYDKFMQQLENLEQILDRIAQKSNVAGDAIKKVVNE